MSILQVANVQFETTGANRIEYTGNNVIRVKGAGLQLPVVTNVTKPSPEPGMMLYNSDTGNMEMMGAGGAGLSFASNSSVASVFAVANAGFGKANTALQNTSGTFSGNFNVSGNVTIANTSMVYHPYSNFTISEASSFGAGLALRSSSNGVSRVFFTVDGSDANTGLIRYDHGQNSMQFWTNPRDGISTYERMRIDSSGSVGIGTTTPYSTLEITPSPVGWGEGIVINPSSSGYSGIFFRKAGTSGSNVANTWSIGKSTGTPERLQVLINGLTGGVGVDRGDAIQQWKANGDVIFGFNVGIRTDPSSPLHISGPVADSLPILRLSASSNTSSPFQWISTALAPNIGAGQNLVHLFGKAQSTPNSGYIGYKHAGDGSYNNSMTIGMYGADNLLNVNASGRVTMPFQPRFCVRTNVLYNAPASTTEMVHTSIVINVGSHYNTSTGRFTAPIAGYYRIWTCFHSVHTSGARHHIAVNGGQVVGAGGGVISSTGDWRQTSLEYQVLLAAGDYISTFVWGGNYIHGDPAWGNWGAELIG